jgi:LysM repeat protein
MDIKLIAGTALAIAMAACGATVSYAQEYENTPVSISKEKVRINGNVCYSHVVLERQTLFSISKAYNVSIDDIYRANPSLKETGLVKNSIILIPAAADPEPAVEHKTETVKETVQEVMQEKVAEVVKEKTVHTVKWYENLNDIAAKYGITTEELMAANGLKGKKLKSRMKLVIPAPGEFAATEETEPETIGQESKELTVTEEPAEAQPEKPWWHGTGKDKVTASVLLPFKANGLSSSWSNMDFYSGVLVAARDLSQNGRNIDLRVHDIGEGKTDAWKSDINGSDIVIGPVSLKDLGSMLAMNTSVMAVSPLDPKAESLALSHRNMIQAPTPHKAQYDDLMAWIKEDKGMHDKVIVISEKGGRQTETVMQMKQSIDSSGLSYNPFAYSILEGRDVLAPLKSLMTPEGANRVIVASESEAFVNDVVRNLNLLIHQKYNVILYGASKIRSFDTIEVENFHNTNLHVSLTYYIDYDDPRVKNFLLKYRALFNTEPSQFAFQGYDIASYFFEMCAKYGERWPEMLDKEEKNMLQSTFRCIKASEGGFINQGVRRIVYEDNWKISKIR